MKKVVLISGGSDGLGKAIAENLAKDYQVVILSPTEEKLKKVAGEIGVDCVVADVTNYKSLVNAVEEVVSKYKKINCLINNAGLWIQGEVDYNDPEYIKKVIDINTLGAIWMAKVVIPQMKKQKEGLIININSQGGLIGRAERSIYCASKWAITGFTRSIQPELVKYGVPVTGIYPDKLNTKMFEKAGIEKDMSDALDPKEVVRVVKFLLETEKGVNFPEIGIKNMNS